MLPAVTVAVGNATALRINPRLPAEAVTVKGTPGRGRVPSPMSTVAVPLKVALPSAPTDPPRTSPSTVMFCAALRRERSEEHTSELQSRFDLVCRLLLEKKKQNITTTITQQPQPNQLTYYA